MLLLGGVSGAGMTAVMQEYRPIFVVVTFGFLGFAFYLTYRPRRTAETQSLHRSPMMAMNKAMLWGVTVVAVVFLFFPQAFTSLVADDDAFIKGMDQSVFSIEGMT